MDTEKCEAIQANILLIQPINPQSCWTSWQRPRGHFSLAYVGSMNCCAVHYIMYHFAVGVWLYNIWHVMVTGVTQTEITS